MPTPEHRLDAKAIRRRDLRRLIIGARIRELRHAANLSQEALAAASGLDRTSVVHLEAGHRSVLIDRMWDLAAAVGVTIADFFAPVEAEVRRVEGHKR